MASSSMTPEEHRTDRPTVLASIDFGTTHSAICYAFPEADGQFHRGRCQPYRSSLYGSKGVKIPTRYPKGIYNGPGYDEGWLEWFKLSIPHRDDLPKDVRVSDKLDKLIKEREEVDISAVDASSKYLGELWKQFHENLDKNTNVEITVTVPAIWPLDARERLLQAIRSRSANILSTNVRLAQNPVVESEAAAIALLSASANTGHLKHPSLVLTLIPSAGLGLLSSAVYASTRRGWDFLQQMAKTGAECPKQAVNDLKDNDYDKFVDRIWHSKMKIEHAVDMGGQVFDLPLKFLGKQAGQSTMEFTAIRNGRGEGTDRGTGNKYKVRSVSPSTHVNQYGDDTGWISVARGAVLHAIQTKSQSAPSIVQIETRASGESYGVGIDNGGPIHWLVRWGDELSAEGLNPRYVPPEAVRHSPDGRCFLDWYRVKGPGAKAEIVRPVYYRNALGEPGDLRFDFHWDGTKMHYVLCQENRQLPLTLGEEYDA
ncbi:hypothetical protein FPCIR_6549 [Fusarium pseudocircinatum]|uniref:Hsp70 protein n=1 Tax=Fusarium pseudocircinatum TaxID=56676 RepID=A0A8H5LDR2_9HYPO|nr:hypothetical protein FPCIR_6549 [Fusarium pseudocircinatum]